MKKMFVILAAMVAATVAQATINPPTGSCPVDACDSSKTWLCHSPGSSGNLVLIHPNNQGELNGHTNHNAVDTCPVITGACVANASGLGRYANQTFSCNGAPPVPVTNSFDLPCANGKCETNIKSSATFDFYVASGGVSQDLYVCDVGFRVNDCENCNSGVDKIIVHTRNADGTAGPDVTIPYPGHHEFDLYPQALTADVFLNSLDYSAGWFVRYCSKTTRLVVGTSGGDLAARLKASIKVDATTGEDNGYLAKAKVLFGVTHSCNDGTVKFAPVKGDVVLTPHGTALVEPGSALEILTEDFLCLNGTSCGKEMCEWTVHFQETACTLRQIKEVTCTPDGVLTCTPYKANIHTSLDLDTNFECITTGSGCI